MKNISLPLLATVVLTLSASLAGAAPWSYGSYRPAPGPPRHGESGYQYNYGHNYYHGGSHRRLSLEAKAQLRLRELGFYRGPIDGDFGRRSRSALAHFQYRKGLRPHGWLDSRTQRALRL